MLTYFEGLRRRLWLSQNIPPLHIISIRFSEYNASEDRRMETSIDGEPYGADFSSSIPYPPPIYLCSQRDLHHP